MSSGESIHDGDTVRLTVPKSVGKQRLDKYLGAREDLDLTRSRAQKLIADGLVLVDGEIYPGKHTLTGGETIEITIPPPPPSEIVPENIPIEVVYEDDYIVVVNKPPGMVAHPAAGNYSGTMANALAWHFDQLSKKPGSIRPGLVHRLDKDTTGLLVVAKTDTAFVKLQEMIKSRELKRTYTGLVCGHMADDTGEIDLPIGRSTRDRKKMAVTHVHSRDALTHYRVKDRFRSYDLLEIELGTGRTHQIRVHFSHLGHPIFGDPDYGGRETWVSAMFGPERPLAKRLLAALGRQALHAARLSFPHPITAEPLSLDAPLPDDFQKVLSLLEAEGR
jgi:23S rRNA pseudouridine1911/1915/1917 synthase